MSKLFLIFLFFSVALIGFTQNTPPIIPLPQSFQPVNEVFKLKDNLSIGVNDPSFEKEAQYLQKQLFVVKSITVFLADNESKADIVLKKQDPGSKIAGAYAMKMDHGKITISAMDDAGIFNGIVSLLQLVSMSKDNSVSCWNIADYPLYPWRGFMLDESRHFFGKEKVKQLLDWMAFYKLNRFHWHLTDDPGWRIEIKKYPLLAYIGGIGNHTNRNAEAAYYTQDDISEIVNYAAERKIAIIPEIDMPGHARAANRAYPQFSGGGSERYPDFTFDPGNEKTYQYLTDILKEVNVLFPSEMIHLGGDEVHFGNEQWNSNPGVKALMEKQKMSTLAEVEKYFMVRMADSLYAMNNKFLAWDEMADISLPINKTIIFWWRHDKPEHLKKALDKNYNVVLCPRIPLYFDFVQDSTHVTGRRWAGAFSDLQGVYEFPGKAVVGKARQHQILGIQANLWTETVGTGTRLDYLTFPRMSALAEAAWSEKRDYGDFLHRLDRQLPLYRAENIYFFNPFAASDNPEPQY